MRAVPSFFIEKFDAELPEVVKNLYFSLNTHLRKAKVIFGHHFLRRIKSNG